jgi:hypothetical protein
MKKLMFGTVVAMLLAGCISSSVIRGSGREARGEFDISLDYTSLSVSSGITVELVRSDVGTGFITADEEVLEYVSIVEEEGHVKVSYAPFVTVQSRIKTMVTLPLGERLSRLDVSSAARIVSGERLPGTSIEIECTSAGEIETGIDAVDVSIDLSSAASFSGNVVAEKLTVEVTSAAKCNVSGNVDLCLAGVSSAGDMRGFDLVCRRAEVDASSAGKIEIAATGELVADASSGGSVRYHGTPSIVRRDTSSGGSVREITN